MNETERTKPIRINEDLHAKLKTRASAERKTLKRLVEKQLKPLVGKNGKARKS